MFELPDFFVDFVAGFFLLIFVGKKCPEKSSRKIPGKILQNLYNKNPRQLSAEGPGQDMHDLAGQQSDQVWDSNILFVAVALSFQS